MSVENVGYKYECMFCGKKFERSFKTLSYVAMTATSGTGSLKKRTQRRVCKCFSLEREYLRYLNGLKPYLMAKRNK